MGSLTLTVTLAPALARTRTRTLPLPLTKVCIVDSLADLLASQGVEGIDDMDADDTDELLDAFEAADGGGGYKVSSSLLVTRTNPNPNPSPDPDPDPNPNPSPNLHSVPSPSPNPIPDPNPNQDLVELRYHGRVGRGGGCHRGRLHRRRRLLGEQDPRGARDARPTLPRRRGERRAAGRRLSTLRRARGRAAAPRDMTYSHS